MFTLGQTVKIIATDHVGVVIVVLPTKYVIRNLNDLSELSAEDGDIEAL